MISKKLVPVILMVILIFAMVVPASAQLGDTDVSSITVQNISTTNATVTVTFVSESGVEYTPLQLDNQTPTGFPNPFVLTPNQSRQIFVPNIPAAQLPSGRYSVVISSNVQVVAVAGVSGTGTTRFTGSYSGFSAGASPVYLATVAFNFNGWYSMISVQNLGGSPADVTVTITCTSGAVGTLSAIDIPTMASHTWALKNTTPSGFSPGTVCIGSASVTSDQPVVAVNSQNQPGTGRTNTFEGAAAGSSKLYVPHLQNNYSGWNSSLNIRKIGSGSTTVTIDYSDAEPSDQCVLTDAIPSCQLYMPSFHPTVGRFGATITSSPAREMLAVVGSSKGTLSGAYVGFGSGSNEVSIPLVTKYYFNWVSAITCQNVSVTPTTLNVTYQGYAPYNHPTTLNEGDSVQILVASEAFLPNGAQVGAVIKANAPAASIACIVGNSNPTNAATTPGDWTNQYNGFNK